MEENNTNIVSTAKDDYALLLESTILIHNKEIRKFVCDFLAERVPEYFKTIPAARQAEHHMAGSHGEGGLIRHTLCVVSVLYDIIQLKYLQFKATDKDLILAAGILHDTFKWGKEGITYERSHPSIAANEVLAYAKERNQEQLGKILAHLIIGHMGEWGAQKPGNRGQFIVHLGDYIGSRAYLTLSFDMLKNAIEEEKKRKELNT